MVEGNYVAWIKSDRVKELVTGECKNPLYPTSFRKSYSSKTEKEKEKENDGNQMCRIDSRLRIYNVSFSLLFSVLGNWLR